MSASVLILGARSDIARACAHRYAREGYHVRLAARDPDSLEAEATDIALRYNVQATVHGFDALESESFAGFVDALPELPDVVLSAVGYMGEQEESQSDPQAAAEVIRSNFEGPALILGLLAERFESRGHGVIIGISSVAGDRGRASNYVYGAAKAGFTAFLSGLRNRFSRSDLQVITVKPGFVATRMTEGMDLNPRLTAQPEAVAQAIWRAQARRRNVIYVKPVWGLVMAIICHLPEFAFKRTRF
ncbi:SDR family oxidoreductase [Pararhodobacter oceanensis]|uniref:Short-chain dehydrogenase n=1 Tax=Pararhodobacter oceanensis TaxID=2172121 RepID=A0A2T8HXH5_9RHOB|nr:SDR family oxidoreductase [Pararhodobacter oceanensis]PVH30135.1 short-chain dehydrogenase [Pararhodobacter oceanensis]